MDSVTNLTTFVIAGILLNLTPGQDTIYILGRSIAQGRKAGIVSVLGISTGALVHIAASAFGLSAILMTSAVIFSIIKYIGAGYLVYLGIRMFLNKSDNLGGSFDSVSAGTNYRKIYLQGILTNVLNPKMAMFFLAFLPQFINPVHAKGPLPFMLLGCIFLTTGTVWCLIVAVFSSYATTALRSRTIVRKTMERISGGLFVLLGVKLAFEKS